MIKQKSLKLKQNGKKLNMHEVEEQVFEEKFTDFEKFQQEKENYPFAKNNVTPPTISQQPDIPELKKNRKLKKGLKIFGIIFFIILIIAGILSYLFIYVPINHIKDSANNIKADASKLSSDFDNKDLTAIDSTFENINLEIANINSELQRFKFLDKISFTKGYYENLQIVQAATLKGSNLLSTSLPELKDVLSATGFSVTDANGNVVTPEAQEKNEDGTDKSSITIIMAHMSEYLDFYKNIETDLYSIFEDVQAIDPQYVPNIPGYDFKDKLEKANKFIDDYPELSTKTIGFLENIPELIGASDDEPTRYLVILQNEAEIRAAGGIITAYGVMTLENGELKDDINLTDSWNLENYISESLGIDPGYYNIYGQNVLMNMGCGSTHLRAQDSGIYPDLYWSMTTFADYYDIANSYNDIDFPDYDHILLLDHTFAENLLGLIQPLTVEGFGEVTADNLFDFIKGQTDDPSLSYSADRKAIIGDIANAAKKKFFEKDISEMPEIAHTLINAIYAKDLSLATRTDENLQTFFDNYGMSARTVMDFKGDYFQLNEAQNCSLKLNRWVRDSVTQDININIDGSVSKQVHVEWEQPQIYDSSLELQYSPNTSHSYRAWVRLFAPEGTEEFDSDGYFSSGYVGYYPQEYYDDVMDKDVSDNIIQFDHRRFSEEDPIPTQELNISYELPSSINYVTDGKFQMLIQKDPGKSWGEPYKLNFNYQGQTYTIEFTLDRDKIVTFKNGVILVDNYNKNLDWVLNLIDSL